MRNTVRIEGMDWWRGDSPVKGTVQAGPAVKMQVVSGAVSEQCVRRVGPRWKGGEWEFGGRGVEGWGRPMKAARVAVEVWGRAGKVVDGRGCTRMCEQGNVRTRGGGGVNKGRKRCAYLVRVDEQVYGSFLR